MQKEFVSEITLEIAEDKPDARMPLIMKVIGALLILGGALAVLAMAAVIVGSGMGMRQGLFADDSALSFILYWVLVIALGYAAAASVVLGVRLVRGNRRRARLLAESVAIALVVAFGSDFMLEGISASVWPLALTAIILIVAHVVVDPALSDERRLQRQLRMMETRDEAEEGTLGLDKSGQGFIELDFFNIFWIFVVASVIGVVIESVYHVLVVDFGHYEDRAGLLFGPFSPIYGCGAVLMTLALNRFHKAPVWTVFCVSAVIGGAFEYFTSCFMEYCFGAVAWDYTGTFLNINGRTNFMFMCMWGRWGLCGFAGAAGAAVRDQPHSLAVALFGYGGVRGADGGGLLHDAGGAGLLVQPPFRAFADNALEWFCAEHFDNTWMENRFESMSIVPDTARR